MRQVTFKPGLEEFNELLAFFFGEAGADADVLEGAAIVVEAQQQRSDGRAFAFFVPAETGDDAVAVALVLDFEHHALVRLVGTSDGLGDDTVETGAFKATEPVEGDFAVAGCGRDMDGRSGCGEQ